MRGAVIGGILAIVLVTVGWYFLFFRPASEQQAALEAETAALVQEQNQLRAQINALRMIEERAVEIRADLARAEELIPSAPSQPSLVRQLQLAADAAGVDLVQLLFADPEVVEGAPPTGDPALVLGRIPNTMQFRGGFFQVVDFLRRLEVDVPRALLVRVVNIDESADGFPLLVVTLESDAFALILPPVSPPVEGAVIPPEPGATETPTPGATPGATPTPTPGGAAS